MPFATDDRENTDCPICRVDPEARKKLMGKYRECWACPFYNSMGKKVKTIDEKDRELE